MTEAENNLHKTDAKFFSTLILTLSFRVGFNSLISRVSFILHCVSDRRFASISKKSHFKIFSSTYRTKSKGDQCYYKHIYLQNRI